MSLRLQKFFHEGLTEREAWDKIRAEFRGWSVADRRMLWIAIMGGLVGNVVTVLSPFRRNAASSKAMAAPRGRNRLPS
jgi:hypothetical protein